MTRAESPNDPKLSDGGGQARRLPVAVRWWRSFAAAVTGRSRSLQRMVRRSVELEMECVNVDDIRDAFVKRFTAPCRLPHRLVSEYLGTLPVPEKCPPCEKGASDVLHS